MDYAQYSPALGDDAALTPSASPGAVQTGTLGDVELIDSAPGSPIAQGTPTPTATPSGLRRGMSWRPSELMRGASSSALRASSRDGRPPMGRSGRGGPGFVPVPPGQTPPTRLSSSRASSRASHFDGSSLGLDDDEEEESPVELTQDQALLKALADRETAARQHVAQAHATLLAAMERRFLSTRHDLEIGARRKAIMAARAGTQDAKTDRRGSPPNSGPDPELLRKCPWKTPSSTLQGILKAPKKGGSKGAASKKEKEKAAGWNALRSGGVRQRLKAMRFVVDQPGADQAASAPSQSPLIGGSDPSPSQSDMPRKVRFHKTLRVTLIPPREGTVDVDVDIDVKGGGAGGVVEYEAAVASDTSGSESSDAEVDASSRSRRGSGKSGNRKRNTTKPVGFQDRSGKRNVQRRMAKDAPLRPLMPNEAQMLQNALASNAADDMAFQGGDLRSTGALLSVLDNMAGNDPSYSLSHSNDALAASTSAPSSPQSPARAKDRDFMEQSGSQRDRLAATAMSPGERSLGHRPDRSFRAELSEHEKPSQHPDVCFGRRKIDARRTPESDPVTSRLRREAQEMLKTAPRHKLPEGYREDRQFYEREMAWLAATRSKRTTRPRAALHTITASPRRPTAEVASPPTTAPSSHRRERDRRRIVSQPALQPPVYLRRRAPGDGGTRPPNPLLEASMREQEEGLGAFHGTIYDGANEEQSSSDSESRNSLLEAGDGYVWQREPPPPPRVWRAFVDPKGADKRRLDTAERETPAGARWRQLGFEHARDVPVRLTQAGEFPATGPPGLLGRSGTSASPERMVAVLDDMARGHQPPSRCAADRGPSQPSNPQQATHFTGIALPRIPSATAPRRTEPPAAPERAGIVDAALERLSSSTSRVRAPPRPRAQSPTRSPAAPPRPRSRARSPPQQAQSGTQLSPAEAVDAERRRLLRELERVVARNELAEGLSPTGPPGLTTPGADSARTASRGDRRNSKGSCKQPTTARTARTPLTQGSTAAREAMRSMRVGKDLLRQRQQRTVGQRGAKGSVGTHVLSRDDVERDEAYRRGAAVIFGQAPDR